MSRYLFIESRDPFDARDREFVVETATDLKSRGNDVTVFLIQNGVLAARKRARVSTISLLAEAGVRVLADDFSLRERGLRASDLASEVKEAGIGTLVDLLASRDTKAIWH